MSYVVGIDAGGTKTLGLLADAEGEVLASASLEGAHLQMLGEAGVEDILRRLLARLDPPGPIAAGGLGMGGVDRPAEKAVMEGVLRRLGIPRSAIANDADIALVAGAGERRGIVLVAGTGTIAYGLNRSGQSARANGWGYLLADEGSAFWIGQRALRRSLRSLDGRGAPTLLGERILNHLGLTDLAGLMAWAYGEGSPRYRFAGLAPIVSKAAEEGDTIALELLEDTTRHLLAAVHAVAGQLSFEHPFPIVLAGGVLQGWETLARRVADRLQVPGGLAVRLEEPAALGAVRLAQQLL